MRPRNVSITYIYKYKQNKQVWIDCAYMYDIAKCNKYMEQSNNKKINIVKGINLVKNGVDWVTKLK